MIIGPYLVCLCLLILLLLLGNRPNLNSFVKLQLKTTKLLEDIVQQN